MKDSMGNMSAVLYVDFRDCHWRIYVSMKRGGLVFCLPEDPNSDTMLRYDEVKYFYQNPIYFSKLPGWNDASPAEQNTLRACCKRYLDEYEPIRLNPEKNGWHRLRHPKDDYA